jgi:hypothetical protein
MRSLRFERLRGRERYWFIASLWKSLGFNPPLSQFPLIPNAWRIVTFVISHVSDIALYIQHTIKLFHHIHHFILRWICFLICTHEGQFFTLKSSVSFDTCMMSCIHNYSVIQNSFITLKIACILLIQSSLLYSHILDAHWSFYCLYSFVLLRISYNWSMLSLFRLASSLHCAFKIYPRLFMAP